MSIEITMPSYTLPVLVEMLILLVIGISAVTPGIDRWSRGYILAFFSVLAFGEAIFIIDTLTYMNPDMYEISVWLPLIEYMMLAVPPVIFAFNLLHECGEDWKKSVLIYAIVSLWAAYFALHITAYFTNFFYYTSSDGRFFLKASHPLLFVPAIAMLIIDLIAVIKRRSKFSRRLFFSSLLYLVPSIAAMTIHALLFNVMALNLAVCIGSLAMYIFLLADEIEQYTRQQTAIANQNAKIMVLQMRPHFIYNTMASIYYLCDQDPKKAKQVILDLTSYLRKNFNGMASNDTVPFSEELEHIRAYLAVELAQFEDNLLVEYDTPHTWFRLPPLTLQPLVENAIKHGMNPDMEPLRIEICTLKTDSGSVIFVKDNGPGFDPADVFNANNALSNIKQRLEMMCHGSITITSGKGEGTVVKVVIPMTKSMAE